MAAGTIGFPSLFIQLSLVMIGMTIGTLSILQGSGVISGSVTFFTTHGFMLSFELVIGFIVIKTVPVFNG